MRANAPAKALKLANRHNPKPVIAAFLAKPIKLLDWLPVRKRIATATFNCAPRRSVLKDSSNRAFLFFGKLGFFRNIFKLLRNKGRNVLRIARWTLSDHLIENRFPV